MIMRYPKEQERRIEPSKGRSLNPSPEYEQRFKPAEDVIFHGRNQRTVYSERSVRVGKYDTDRGYYYR